MRVRTEGGSGRQVDVSPPYFYLSVASHAEVTIHNIYLQTSFKIISYVTTKS